MTDYGEVTITRLGKQERKKEEEEARQGEDRREGGKERTGGERRRVMWSHQLVLRGPRGVGNPSQSLQTPGVHAVLG